MVALRECVLVDRRLPALGHRLHDPRRLQQRERREYQTVSIPSGQAANYTFWLNITTSESGPTPYDYLYAEVRSTTGALLSTLATYTNANATTAR